MQDIMDIKDIAFPNLGIYLRNVPKSFSIFGFQIALYGVIIGIGVLCGVLLAAHVAKKEKVDNKSAKKSLGGKKKEAPKKDGVTALEGSENQKTVQMAKMFPETLEVGDVKYQLAHDIQTIEELHNALANDEEIVFAYYWTARHLKQFPYYSGLLPAPKKFDNDLDLATCIYVSDDNVVSYQISMYTEAMYMTLPTDIVEEDGLRISRGVEYQIYRAV